jgi:tetratricopeptide (TPR) repeat protein
VAECVSCKKQFSEKDFVKNHEFISLIKEGKESLDEKQYDDAAIYFDSALNIYKTSPFAWNLKGMALSETKHYNGALDCYKKALTNNECHEVHYNKAVTLLRMDKKSEALDSIDKALSLNSHDLDSIYVKGYILSRMNNPRNAIECFNEVLKKNPEHTGAKKEKDFIQKRG